MITELYKHCLIIIKNKTKTYPLPNIFYIIYRYGTTDCIWCDWVESEQSAFQNAKRKIDEDWSRS